MTFPVCNIFEPTIYQGRLCYQANVQSHQGDLEGEKGGLTLIIDASTDRSIDISNSVTTNVTQLPRHNMFVANNQSIIKKQASIHIGTLARYNRYISGDAMYALDGISKMTGTARFLGWPEEKRKCSLEKYEACQLRGFLETSKQCDCIPFQLVPGTKDKKKVHMTFI